jgi:hypothetical protein
VRVHPPSTPCEQVLGAWREALSLPWGLIFFYSDPDAEFGKLLGVDAASPDRGRYGCDGVGIVPPPPRSHTHTPHHHHHHLQHHLPWRVAHVLQCSQLVRRLPWWCAHVMVEAGTSSAV